MPLHPQHDALEEMAERDGDAPIVMLNLLRFRKQAEAGHGVDGLSGEEAYREYGRRFATLNPRFGGEPVWMGRTEAVLIGAENEAWDLAILVRYPTRGQSYPCSPTPITRRSRRCAPPHYRTRAWSR